VRVSSERVFAILITVPDATVDEVYGLAGLAEENGCGMLNRLVEVIGAWAQSGTPGDIDAYYARGAALDLSDLLPKLPELAGYNSEIEFVLGYKPLAMAALPEADVDELKRWQSFHGRAFANVDVSERDEAAAIRDCWIPLVNDLARFLGRRRRIARARKAGRRS
jgi:hypothetical protein